MRFFSAEDVRQALPMADAIEAVRKGFMALSEGSAIVPIRGVLKTEHGFTLAMPANLDATTSVKIVSVYPDNPQKNLPAIHGLVLVIDAQTGIPQAIMEGGVLTAIRTGAGAGVATKYLARNDARILGVIGAGVQARTQIAAVCAVRDIHEILIYSRTQANAEKMAEEIQSLYDAKITVVATAKVATQSADVIVAATNSATPVIEAQHLKAGVHINGVGSFTPQMQEIGEDIITQAKLVVDHYESVWEEAGDLIIPRDKGLISEESVHAEIGEIAGGKKVGRENDTEITFFKSVGNAIQDVVSAQRVLEIAEEKGLGTILPL